jgi:hypothetical protein
MTQKTPTHWMFGGALPGNHYFLAAWARNETTEDQFRSYVAPLAERLAADWTGRVIRDWRPVARQSC